MKRFFIPNVLGMLLSPSQPAVHQYKKRPVSIRAMTDLQIDNLRLLEHQRALQYALHLQRQWLRRLEEEQRALIRLKAEDSYKAF